MATKTMGSCAICGYPIAASYEGESVTCPMCKNVNIAQGVTIPTWVLAGGIGLAIGVMAGPAIMASTETGQKWLEKQVRERVR